MSETWIISIEKNEGFGQGHKVRDTFENLRAMFAELRLNIPNGFLADKYSDYTGPTINCDAFLEIARYKW